jgi:hypothetical protein
MLPTPESVFAKISENITTNETAQIMQAKVSGFFGTYLPWLKVLSILVSALLFGLVIFFLIKTGWFALRASRIKDVVLKVNISKKKSVKIWKNIQRHFYAGDDNSLKLALLEADKALDEILVVSGFKGGSLGDKLKKLTTAEISNLDEVWEAHKLRNRIVHELDFKLNREIAEKALGIYQRTFEELGLLDSK